MKQGARLDKGLDRTPLKILLSFDTAYNNALDQLALNKRKDDHHRQHGNHGDGHAHPDAGQVHARQISAFGQR